MDPIQKHVLKRSETAEMTERELLMELVEEKRRAETWRYIQIAWNVLILLIILILAIRFLPGIIAFFREIHDTLQSIKQTAENISSGYQQLADSFSKIGGDGFTMQDLFTFFGANSPS